MGRYGDMSLIPGPKQGVKGSGVAYVPAGVWIQSLAQEFSYAVGAVAIKKKNKNKKQKQKQKNKQTKKKHGGKEYFLPIAETPSGPWF